jgi:hypothetical protein
MTQIKTWLPLYPGAISFRTEKLPLSETNDFVNCFEEEFHDQRKYLCTSGDFSRYIRWSAVHLAFALDL